MNGTCEMCGHEGNVTTAPLNWTRRVCADTQACAERRGWVAPTHVDDCDNPFCEGSCTAGGAR